MRAVMMVGAACGLAFIAVATGAIAQDNAPIKTKTGVIGAPAEGKAQIIFFRPGTIMGAALGCTVHEGNRELARLGAGKYYVVTTEPGKHAFSTRGQTADTLNLETEADETYFVKCRIGPGIMAGGAQLEPSDRESFAKKAAGSSMWVPSEDWLKKQGG